MQEGYNPCTGEEEDNVQGLTGIPGTGGGGDSVQDLAAPGNPAI